MDIKLANVILKHVSSGIGSGSLLFRCSEDDCPWCSWWFEHLTKEEQKDFINETEKQEIYRSLSLQGN